MKRTRIGFGWVSLSLLATAVLALPGTSFQIEDGDLFAEGGLDWESLAGSPDLKIGVDLPTGQTDDSLAGKEDYLAPGITFGSIPNNKSNLLRFYVAHEPVEVNGEFEDFIHMAWIRSNTLGSANMDFEFNQGDQVSENGVTPVRLAGDMLITFAFSGGGNQVELGLSLWTDVGPCEAANLAPCWGPVMELAGIASGSVNSAEVTDPIEGAQLAESTFGEATINLTQAGVFDREECISFGTAYVKSRSSTSFTSSMKDFIRPMDVSVTNCATVSVRKDAVPNHEQDFSFTASAELGVTGFDLDDDGDDSNELASSILLEGRFDETIVVGELAEPGWDLTDVSCSGPAVAATDGDGVLTGEVLIDAEAGDNVDCTFTNTQRGRILVQQITDPDGDPQLFNFQLAGGPDDLSQSFGLTDNAPANDSGTIRPGGYVVTQQSAGPEWDLTSASCDDGSSVDNVILDPGETVLCTFVNTRRGRILIDQVTVPSADPQSFSFSLAGGPTSLNQSFALNDAAALHDSGLVRSGSYVATQTDPGAEWDLTSASCDDGSAVDDVNVAPGETVTCTFVNTKRGRVLIDQVTIPADDPQPFGFDLTGGPDSTNQSFSLTDSATPHDSGFVRNGSYNAAQTDPGGGWDLTSAACDDGSSVDAIDLAPGETVICTFVNTKRGRIVIDQVTDPSGDPQAFAFDLSGGPDAIDQHPNLTDSATPHDSGLQQPGVYAISQADPGAAWDLQSATCADGSSVSAIALDPGEVVTCTFVNIKRGRILVDQVTVPAADPQVFAFGLSGGPDSLEQSFGLTDSSDPHDSGFVRSGGYVAQQTDPGSEWDLTNATCDGGQAPDSIVLSPGATVTCTFVNTKRGKIIVDQVTLPTGDPQIFQFNLTGGADAIGQEFGLSDGATPHDSGV
ncbi:MAG: hypothetical protein OEV00_05865, partial [Acidobacteriota bacterium]|nr:hypothetical protein [Acidobacteriota bacterium]